jgi:quinoprotein glucose dehydrogenase
LIDLTPELKQQALEIARQYKMGPLFTPPIVQDEDGKRALLMLPNTRGGANWPGGALDAETGVVYIASANRMTSLALYKPEATRSDMNLVATYGYASGTSNRNIGPQGLPLAKPPWGKIIAIDLNSGDHLWEIPNDEPSDYVKNHPALKGVDLSGVGNSERSTLMVTKTLLFAGVGAGLFNNDFGAGNPYFRAIDKATGKVLHRMELPTGTTGIPMTYMVNGRQYVVVAVGGVGKPAELVALAVP